MWESVEVFYFCKSKKNDARKARYLTKRQILREDEEKKKAMAELHAEVTLEERRRSIQ